MDFESLNYRDAPAVELFLLEMVRTIRDRGGRATSLETSRILDLLAWTGSDEATIVRLWDVYDVLGE